MSTQDGPFRPSIDARSALSRVDASASLDVTSSETLQEGSTAPCRGSPIREPGVARR